MTGERDVPGMFYCGNQVDDTFPGTFWGPRALLI